MCNASEIGALSYDKFSFAKKNYDNCTLEFMAFHNAGCGMVKPSGFIQYLNSYKLFFGIILICVGIAICFFGGYKIKFLYGGIMALIFIF
jgi:hypothetical protein